jgi:hypothetical protein
MSFWRKTSLLSVNPCEARELCAGLSLTNKKMGVQNDWILAEEVAITANQLVES